LPARRAAHGADTGIVDQEVEAVGGTGDGFGKAARLVERREVGCEERGAAAALLDLANEPFAALAAAPMGQHAPAVGGVSRRYHPAHAICRACDERGAFASPPHVVHPCQVLMDRTSRTMSMPLASIPNQSR